MDVTKLEKGANLDGEMKVSDNAVPVSEMQTPETYLGFKRASNYTGTVPLSGSTPIRDFTLSETLGPNKWSLGGKWETTSEKITARGNSTLSFKVSAKDVYVVGGSPDTKEITVLLNGQPITANKGSDVVDSKVKIDESKLYRLVSFSQFTKDQTVTLQVPDDVELNVFTFGS